MDLGISTPDDCRNYVQSFRRGAILKSINTGYKPSNLEPIDSWCAEIIKIDELR
jgi:hypothetical protein